MQCLRYLTPRQTSVTTFLASLAQATHTHVPPELLEPPVRKIANDFVTEAVASEVAAAGLNAIREICTRQPLALDDVLLQDLVMYRTSKDKGVMMAARGLLSLYRSVAPQMLKKKDLGREAALNMRAQVKEQRRFGESNAGGIEGIELLEQWKADERRKMREERLARGEEQPGGSKAGSGTDSEVEKEDNWKEWQVQDDSDSDDSGGWLDVPNDDEIDVKFSDDSGDDKPPAAKKRKGDENENGMTAPLNTNGTPKETNGGNEEEEGSKTAENKTGMDGSFATRHILTPSDLAKLKQLRAEAAVKSLLPFAKRSQKQVASTIRRHIGYDEHEDDTVITAERIEAAASLSRRVTKEDKLIAAGKQVPLKADGQYEYERGSTVTGGTGLGSRKDRPEEKHRRLGKAARKAERKREAGKSSTNREKARKKNVLMTLSKARVKMKKGSGGRLVHKSRALRGTGRGKGKR